VPGESQLESRGENPADAGLLVVDEDRLRESQVGGDRLALGRRNLSAVQEDGEGVTPLALLAGEDAEDVELGHRRAAQRIGRKFSISNGVTWTR
jgi:hypothetical protein